MNSFSGNGTIKNKLLDYLVIFIASMTVIVIIAIIVLMNKNKFVQIIDNLST